MNTRHKITQYMSVKIGAFSAQCLFLLVLFVLGAVMAGAQGKSGGARRNATARAGPDKKSTPEAKRPHPWQRIVREGVAIEFDIAPLASRDGKETKLMEETEAVVTFKITDTTTGTPITNMRPSAWLDSRTSDKPTEMKECREKIQSFLQGSLGARPEIDLNTYYLLVMNREPNISVIDPLLGLGTSKLFTLILLDSPGEDWAMSRDGKRLFVSMPLVNQVAVVDTNSFKVISKIDVGTSPRRILFQPDEKYLWVSTDWPGASGVTAIDPISFKVAARIATGAGRHDIAFEGDRFAFVSNGKEGTLSVIDTQRLKKIRDVKTAPSATSVAYSPLSRAVYVASETEGAVVAIDARSHRVVARIQAKPGLSVIRFTPTGRWGFVANSKENSVHIIDSSTNRILHTVEVGKQPDQIVFTGAFAYIRSLGTEQISLIPLADLGKGAAKITQFSGGQFPPGKVGATPGADAIVPAPEGNAALVANPADKMIYYYKEGMIAPMGNFQNYRREPKGVLVVDRSMRETSPGTYSNVVKLPPAGNHEVVLLTDSPRISHCFDLTVTANPALKKRKEIALEIEPLFKHGEVVVRKSTLLRFKVIDPETKQPRTGLKDLGVLTFLSPGVWQKRQWARALGEGVYEIDFVPPQQGVYFIFVECPSLGVRFNQLPYSVLQAREEKLSTP